jgi:hypothetical protein
MTTMTEIEALRRMVDAAAKNADQAEKELYRRERAIETARKMLTPADWYFVEEILAGKAPDTDPHDFKMVFGLAPPVERSGPVTLTIGLPRACWTRLAGGLTTDLNLERLGLPIQLIVFGCDSHEHGRKIIEKANAAKGFATDDRQREDYSIKAPGDEEGKS